MYIYLNIALHIFCSRDKSPLYAEATYHQVKIRKIVELLPPIYGPGWATQNQQIWETMGKDYVQQQTLEG